MKNKISVKSRLIAFMLGCWFLPLVLIAITTSYYLTSDRVKHEIAQEMQQLQFMDEKTMENLESVILKSREATYRGILTDLYADYKNQKISQQTLINKSYFFLRDCYTTGDKICMAVCWYREDPPKIACSTYNSTAGASYSCIKKYWEEDHEAIKMVAKDLNTRVAFYQSGRDLYLVRNLYNRSYDNIATLVLLLNNETCFQSYDALNAGASVTVQIDDCILPVCGKLLTREQAGFTELQSASFEYVRDDQNLYASHISNQRDYRFKSLVHFPKNTIAELLAGYQDVFVIMILCSIPMLLILLYVYHRHVTRPIHHLMAGAKQIAEGDLGYQIQYEPQSREFAYLTDCVNSMSRKIKHQFEQISKEEIALRDARIKALQLHINPHFMNNTLEIINWEARLSGNEKISKMIEALGTLMNAGMDRKNRRMIPLSEEMVYINAYLYITEERLGDRLTVINELPDDIMNCMVPRLILQPIVENAIEHGVVQRGRGTVILYGHTEGGYLYLEIMNESVLTEKDRAKIAHLLDINYDSSQEPSGNLGISNVNQRLRMIYGEPCGLTINQVDESHICTKLTLRIEKE